MWNGFLCGCGGLKLIYVRRISTANVLFTLQLNINFVSWYCNYFLLTAVHSSNQLATRIEWQNTCPIMFLHATTRCGRLHSVHCTDWWKTASPSHTHTHLETLKLCCYCQQRLWGSQLILLIHIGFMARPDSTRGVILDRDSPAAAVVIVGLLLASALFTLLPHSSLPVTLPTLAITKAS